MLGREGLYLVTMGSGAAGGPKDLSAHIYFIERGYYPGGIMWYNHCQRSSLRDYLIANIMASRC